VVFEINEITSRYIVRLKQGHKVDFSGGRLHEILGSEASYRSRQNIDRRQLSQISQRYDREIR
jgi:hypothetical protein